MGLAQREKEPEIIDRPDLDPQVLANELRGLRRVNILSQSARILWKPIRRELLRAVAEDPGAETASRGRSLRFLDLATGGGDLPIRLWRKARRKGLHLDVEGCDVNPHCVEHATREAERAGVEARFFQHDVLADGVPPGYDIVACSLFLHHVDDDQVVAFLRNMRDAAGRLALVNDLTRSWGGLVLSYIGPRLVSRSHIMHVDAPRSVRAAFTVAEVRQLAAKAGWNGATVTRHWPYRFLLAWKRPPDT